MSEIFKKADIFHSIFFKLFLVSFLISLFLFISLISISRQNSLKALENQKYEDATLIINKTSQYLDMYIQNIKNILLILTEDNNLLNEDAGKINTILRKYTTNNSNVISNIFLVYKDGRVLSNDQTLYDIIGHDKLKQIVDTAPPQYEGISWSEPYSSRLSTGNTIAFIKPVYNNEKVLIAHAVIEINLRYLSIHLINLLENNSQSFIIQSQKGNIVASNPNTGKTPQYLNDINKISKLKKGIDYLEYENTTAMTVMDDNNQIGWKSIIFTEKEYFFKNIEDLNNRFLLIGGIYVILIIISNLLISLNFSRPIKELAFQMDNIQNEKLSIMKLSHRKDELGKLTRSFEEMIDRIRSLMERQMEILENKRHMELKLLQNQIHPHFLGNTLSCISSFAKSNQMDMVQEMIRSLILMLNFSMDKIDEFITLEGELKFLEAYIKIQKIRYGDKFEYVEMVPEEHKLMKIPKLILQPIIENAIFHGISGKKDNGFIIIKTLLLEDTFHIFINDNGSGMSREKIDTILSNSTDSDIGEYIDNPRSIGIRNVNERIKLYFGENYGIFITSRPEKGTQVEVCLPKETE